MPIIRFLRKNKGSSILEVGSGYQGLGKFYHKKFTGLDLTPIEYGPREQLPNKYMNFIQGSCLNLPFKDNSFDFVFSLDMVEHLNPHDRGQSFKEMIRVSKKDIIIAFPCDKLAHHYDHLLYEQLKAEKNTIPGRLQEHVECGIPMLDEIKSILLNIDNIQRTYEWNANIWSRATVMYLESKGKLGTLLSLIISYTIKLFNISFNNTYGGYRLFLFIKKGK